MRKSGLGGAGIGIALLALALGSAFARGREDGGPSVAELAWLEGSWTASRGEASIEELWTRPAGGTMLGVNR